MRIHTGSVEVTVTRYVDAICPRCQGDGQRAYSSTSTWRGGMGGASISYDVCDACWGTGDAQNPGCDLRLLRDQADAEATRRAAKLLEDAMGAGLGTLAPAQRFLADVLLAAARKRSAPQWCYNLAHLLARKLRELADSSTKGL